MRKIVYLAALVLVLSLFPLLSAQGQVCQIFTGDGGAWEGTDTLACDTVRIGCPVTMPVVNVGDSIGIPFYIFTDSPLGVGGYSLGLSYPGDTYEITSVKAEVSLPPFTFAFINQFKPAENKVLLGFLAFSPAGRIPASTTGTATLIATIYLKITSATPAGTTVNLDSAFVAPAGSFEMSVITAGVPPAGDVNNNIVPKYIDCGLIDIRLPVQEFDSPVLPQAFGLQQNSPNPFNPSTTIDFALPRSEKVLIEVFNVLGQKVRTLHDGYLNAGYKRVEWDGTNENGNQVASGVYLYRMKAGNFTATKKMMLMK